MVGLARDAAFDGADVAGLDSDARNLALRGKGVFEHQGLARVPPDTLAFGANNLAEWDLER